MGYDITFHPISRSELQTFIFDVIDQPELANARVVMLTNNATDQRAVADIYARFAAWKQEVKAKRKEFAAALAGYLHPYWYARNASLSFLYEKGFPRFFTSVYDFNPATFADMTDTSAGMISGNYSGGVYVDVANLQPLREALEGQYASLVNEMLGKNEKWALEQVIDYQPPFSQKARVDFPMWRSWENRRKHNCGLRFR